MIEQSLVSPKTSSPSTTLCGLCRGTKLLCGKSRCPVLIRFHSLNKTKSLVDTLNLSGSSPPSIFVGRIGYPKVFVGPMIPPISGDTSLIDTPELWVERNLDDIIDFRSMLVRGKYTVNIYDVDNPNTIIQNTRELALSKYSVFSEALFEKKPQGSTRFYNEIQPHGPSAPLKSFDITNPKYDIHLEKTFYDIDLKAQSAVHKLYEDGVKVSQIQRAFSVGAFGTKKYRRFVPTRWSITAVDSLIGKRLINQTKQNPLINEFRVYFLNQFDNRWVILFMPTEWQYELIEAWYPNTTWNPYGSFTAIYNSYEFYKGRTTYAEIGGCYYAARLAVNELLNNERRQAGVVVLREAHPGYIMPIGVWNVRESVRKALKTPPLNVDTLNESLMLITTKMDIPLKKWIRHSALLNKQLYQTKLEDFRDS
jgi:hypothetical protein